MGDSWVIIGRVTGEKRERYINKAPDSCECIPHLPFSFHFSVFLSVSASLKFRKVAKHFSKESSNSPVHADCVSIITPQSTFGRAKTRCVCCKTSARIGARSIYFSNFVAFFGKNPSITTLNTKNTKLLTHPKHEKQTTFFTQPKHELLTKKLSIL